ncbi:MAG: MFS transporter [Candidatus Schekmanbacteria bacterium]|nr:MAG: MFS transporter [Candidatus Schekmanbacteria bacterium]
MLHKKSETFIGISLRKGVKPHNVTVVYILATIVMILAALPSVILPLFLQEEIGISKGNQGVINTSIAIVNEIMGMICVGFVGLLSDKFGRKRLVSYGFLFAGIFFALLGLSGKAGNLFGLGGLPTVFIARWLLGIALLFIWPLIQAILTDYTYPEGRGKIMAIMGFAFTFGSMLAFALFSKLPALIGVINVFLLAGIISLIFSTVTSFGVVDVMGEKERKKVEWKRIIPVLKESSGLKLTYASAFAARADVIILGMFVMIWVTKVAADFGKTPSQAVAEGGMVIGISSAVGLLSYALWGYMAEKLGRLPTLAFGLFSSGVAYMLIGLIDNPFSKPFLICTLLCALGIHSEGVGAMTLTSDLSPRELVGSILGAYNSFGAVGVIVFLELGGFLFDYVSNTLPFVLTGAADFFVFLYAVMRWKKIRTEEMRARGLLVE